MESQCLIDTKNFIKIKNHFNPFLNIFGVFCVIFLCASDIYIYIVQMYFNVTSYEIKNVVSLAFDFFGF